MLDRVVLTILFVLITSFCVQAQVIEDQDTSEQRFVLVELINGKELVGIILEQSVDHLILRLESGKEMTIPMNEVSSLKYMPVKTWHGRDFFYHNLQATRYFFGPNGFGLKQGEGYYQNTWIFVNQASVGVTDYFSIGVGVVPLFLFDGTATPVWITPKFSFPVQEEALNIGVGGLIGNVIGESESFFGIGYGTFTIGSRDNNINFSLGYGMIDGEWSRNPTITVSGMTRLSRKFYLISENYFLPNLEVSLLSFGGRSLFSKMSMDYGLVIPLEAGGFIGMPWLGITVPFTPKNK